MIPWWWLPITAGVCFALPFIIPVVAAMIRGDGPVGGN